MLRGGGLGMAVCIVCSSTHIDAMLGCADDVVCSSTHIDEMLWCAGCVVCTAAVVILDRTADERRLGMEVALHEVHIKRRPTRECEGFIVKTVSLLIAGARSIGAGKRASENATREAARVHPEEGEHNCEVRGTGGR